MRDRSQALRQGQRSTCQWQQARPRRSSSSSCSFYGLNPRRGFWVLLKLSKYGRKAYACQVPITLVPTRIIKRALRGLREPGWEGNRGLLGKGRDGVRNWKSFCEEQPRFLEHSSFSSRKEESNLRAKFATH